MEQELFPESEILFTSTNPFPPVSAAPFALTKVTTTLHRMPRQPPQVGLILELGAIVNPEYDWQGTPQLPL